MALSSWHPRADGSNAPRGGSEVVRTRPPAGPGVDASDPNVWRVDTRLRAGDAHAVSACRPQPGAGSQAPAGFCGLPAAECCGLLAGVGVQPPDAGSSDAQPSVGVQTPGSACCGQPPRVREGPPGPASGVAGATRVRTSGSAGGAATVEVSPDDAVGPAPAAAASGDGPPVAATGPAVVSRAPLSWAEPACSLGKLSGTPSSAMAPAGSER
jgi:hypothetical protein